MILRWGAEGALSAFAEEMGFPRRDFGNCRSLWGVTDALEPLGVYVVHDWNPDAGTVEISGMSRDKRFPSRRALRLVFEHCYVGLGCQAVVCKADAGNAQVRRWGKMLGAEEYIIPRLRGREASEAVLVMTVEAWRVSRWAGKHEITIPSAAA